MRVRCVLPAPPEAVAHAGGGLCRSPGDEGADRPVVAVRTEGASHKRMLFLRQLSQSPLVSTDVIYLHHFFP